MNRLSQMVPRICCSFVSWQNSDLIILCARSREIASFQRPILIKIIFVLFEFTRAEQSGLRSRFRIDFLGSRVGVYSFAGLYT